MFMQNATESPISPLLNLKSTLKSSQKVFFAEARDKSVSFNDMRSSFDRKISRIENLKDSETADGQDEVDGFFTMKRKRALTD